jgi:hypothetical protein
VGDSVIVKPHYVPVMKARPGEIAAVGQVSEAARTALTPLFELTPPTSDRKNPLTTSQHVAVVFENLALAWTTEQPVGIDLSLLGVGTKLDNGQ